MPNDENFREIMNIFISSNMLDILDLAEPNKTKTRQRQSPIKEERFNLLLVRLRQRNLHNQAFIRRFRQKASRKKVKSPEIASRILIPATEIEDDSSSDQQCDASESKRLFPPCEKAKEYSQKLLQKQNILKETNHTLTQRVSSDDEKTLSFPNLDFCPQDSSPSPRSRPKQTSQNLKQDKQFNKYLRNVFFKEISTKIERKQKQKPMKWQQNEPRRSIGRIKTEMASSKYKLNIQSLIFGCLDPSQNKSQQKIQIQQKPKRAQCGILKNVQRYQREFQDDKLSSKGFLPTIHNHQVTKNKRFLENYIKYNNQDRPFEALPAEARTISLTNDQQMPNPKKEATPSRIGLSLRIQTITIQK